MRQNRFHQSTRPITCIPTTNPPRSANLSTKRPTPRQQSASLALPYPPMAAHLRRQHRYDALPPLAPCNMFGSSPSRLPPVFRLDLQPLERKVIMPRHLCVKKGQTAGCGKPRRPILAFSKYARDGLIRTRLEWLGKRSFSSMSVGTMYVTCSTAVRRSPTGFAALMVIPSRSFGSRAWDREW